MTTEELFRIWRAAQVQSHNTRTNQPGADYEQEARLWDAFADAAFALHAMRRARMSYRSGPPDQDLRGETSN